MLMHCLIYLQKFTKQTLRNRYSTFGIRKFLCHHQEIYTSERQNSMNLSYVIELSTSNSNFKHRFKKKKIREEVKSVIKI